MSETTRKTRTAWTQTEIDYLTANASSGAKAIATHLGRSEAVVRTKAQQLGLSLRQPGSKVGRRLKSETQAVDSI